MHEGGHVCMRKGEHALGRVYVHEGGCAGGWACMREDVWEGTHALMREGMHAGGRECMQVGGNACRQVGMHAWWA